MSLKLGGFNITTFTGKQISADSALLTTGNQTKPLVIPKRFEVPSQVSVQTTAGEDPKLVHQRLLRQAASRAGLDGSAQGEKFVKLYEDYTLKYENAKHDPTPADGANVKAGEVKSGSSSLVLEKEQIAVLKDLQKEHLATGGKLHAGKSYELVPNETAAKQHKTREAADRQKLNQLIQAAQIPTTFGTPSRLRDLKHISVQVPNDTKPVDNDRALLLYIQNAYGNGNLQGDNIAELAQLAKRAGVKVENLNVGNATNGGRQAEFDVSTENLLKLHTLYIGVQAKVNAEVELFENTARNTVANRFAQGVFEGAWESLKANGEILADPIGALNKLKETVVQLSQIDPALVAKAAVEIAKNSPELIGQGAQAINQTKVGDAAHVAGKIVGAGVAELVTGKAVGVAFKGLGALSKSESVGILIAKVASKTQETIKNVPIPTAATVAEIGLTNGSKIKLPVVETKKLSKVLQSL